MGDRFVTRGFVGRRDDGGDASSADDRRRRTPPGQYLTNDFPVLSAGPTPRTPLDRWSLRIEGLVREPVEWSWSKAKGREGGIDFIKAELLEFSVVSVPTNPEALMELSAADKAHLKRMRELVIRLRGMT